MMGILFGGYKALEEAREAADGGQASGGPAPSSEEGGGEAPAASSDGGEASDDAGVDWAGLFSGDEGGESEPAAASDETHEAGQSEESASESARPESEQAPATPQDAESPAAESAPAESEQAPEQAAEPEQPSEKTQEEAQQEAAQQQQPEQTDQKPQEEEAPDWNTLRQQAKESLKERYKLSDEQRSAFEQDPGSVLSEMASDLHIQIFDAVYNTVAQQIPQMVRQVQQVDQARESFESRFYSRWPKLKDQTDTVQQLMQTTKAMKPQASEDELIKLVGIQASTLLGLPPEEGGGQVSGQGNGQAPAGQAPSAEPEAQAPAAGYRPAQPNNGTQPSGGPAPTEWEELLNDDL